MAKIKSYFSKISNRCSSKTQKTVEAMGLTKCTKQLKCRTMQQQEE